MSKVAHNISDVRRLTSELGIALDHPQLIQQCLEKSNAESLYGFSYWWRSRKCKVCRRRVPPNRSKTCSSKHAWKFRCWKRDATRRRNGVQLWIDFSRRVQRPVRIEVVAEKLGLSADEARARAEADVRRGKLIAYRGPGGGPIREVGQPKVAA